MRLKLFKVKIEKIKIPKKRVKFMGSKRENILDRKS